MSDAKACDPRANATLPPIPRKTRAHAAEYPDCTRLSNLQRQARQACHEGSRPGVLDLGEPGDL